MVNVKDAYQEALLDKALKEIKEGEIIELYNCILFPNTHRVVVWYLGDGGPLVGDVDDGSKVKYRHCAKCGQIFYGKELVCKEC